jgi:hypothetical protein
MAIGYELRPRKEFNLEAVGDLHFGDGLVGLEVRLEPAVVEAEFFGRRRRR